MKNHRLNFRLAFTLLELVMVIVIMALMATLAAPRYANSLNRYRVEVAARRVAMDLSYAQARARATCSTRSISFDKSTSTYTLIAESDLNKPGSNYIIDLTQPPYRTTIVSVTFGGGGTLSFNGFGVPNTAGTVRIRCGNQTRNINVDAVTGLTTVQ
jgi:prepilin-type N-terminal cleavage/methylation domain-containing protein